MNLYRLPDAVTIAEYDCVIEWIHEDIEEYVSHPFKIDLILDSHFVPYALQKIPYKKARCATFWNNADNSSVYVVINGGHLEEIIDLQFDSYQGILDYLIKLYAVGTRSLIINSTVAHIVTPGIKSIDSVNFSYRHFKEPEQTVRLAK